MFGRRVSLYETNLVLEFRYGFSWEKFRHFVEPLMAGCTLKVRSAKGLKPLPADCGHPRNPQQNLVGRNI